MSSIDIPALSFALELSQIIFSVIVVGLSTYVTTIHPEAAVDPLFQTSIYILLGASLIAVLIWTYLKFAFRSTVAAYANCIQFVLTGFVALLFMALAIFVTILLAQSEYSHALARTIGWVDAAFAGLSYVVWTMKALLLGINLSKTKDDDDHDFEKIDSAKA